MKRVHFKQSLTNPVFWLFKMCVFLGSFSAASSAFAGGYYWIQSNSTSYRGSTAQEACDNYTTIGNWPNPGVANGMVCELFQSPNMNYFDINYTADSCSGEIWCDDYTVPPNCVSGEEKELITEIPPIQYDEEGHVIVTFTQGIGGSQPTVSSGGCNYTKKQTFGGGEVVSYRPLNEDRPKLYSKEIWVATGEPTPEGQENGTPVYDPADPETPATELQPDDDRITVTDKTVTPETVTAVGSDTVTEQTVIDTETRDKGTVISEETETLTVDYSQGIEKTVTTTTRTIEHADGTVTEEIDQTVAYQQKPGEKIIYDKGQGTITYVKAWEGTSSTTTNTTTSKDAQGNITGTFSTSTRSGSGGTSTTGNGLADGTSDTPGDEFCQQDPQHPSCVEGEFTLTEKSAFEGAADQLVAAKSEYETEFDNFKSQLEAKLNFNIGGGGTVESDLITIRGVQGDIGITKWVPHFDSFGLGALVMSLAGLLSVRVLLGG